MSSKTYRTVLALLAVMLMAPATAAIAADQSVLDAGIRHIERQWAHITYQVKNEDEQDKQMRAILAEAGALSDRYPGHAEPLIWQGVVASSEAKYAGTFSALGFAKQARDLFERAGRLDYRALGGAVPTSLGVLYYMVPGFPLGFGDDDKARQYLEQGVQISPGGLDANYFYGDFLYRQGEYRKAATVLKRALAAPAHPDRPVWDAGRRAEVHALLNKVGDKLASSR